VVVSPLQYLKGVTIVLATRVGISSNKRGSIIQLTVEYIYFSWRSESMFQCPSWYLVSQVP